MIEGIPFTDWGPTGLLALSVLMVLTGRLVPRSLYLEQRQAAEAWRTAWEAERDRNVRLLEPVAHLQRDVLMAIPRPPDQPPGQDGDTG